MRWWMSRGTIAAISIVVAATNTFGQTDTTAPKRSYRHRVLGVFNSRTGEPIEGAEVADRFAGLIALTTKTGTVSLAFLPDGGSLLRIQKIGYVPNTLVVLISPADTVPLTIVLDPIAQTLPAVVTKDSAPRVISPGLQEFERRRRLGFGHFISEAELRKNENRKLTDVVRTLPGLTIACPAGGRRRGECWARSARRGCDVELYINGVTSTDNDLEKLRVSEFAGVEYYAGGASMPVEYNRTGSSCGVLLVWIRER